MCVLRGFLPYTRACGKGSNHGTTEHGECNRSVYIIDTRRATTMNLGRSHYICVSRMYWICIEEQVDTDRSGGVHHPISRRGKARGSICTGPGDDVLAGHHGHKPRG